MYLIDGVPHAYDWGSRSLIQQMTGEPAGEPLAELWFGAHPSAPSPVAGWATATTLLDLIEADSDLALGAAATARFGASLPFLIKLLAPGRAVSVQVHPTPANAAAGFRREQADGIPLASPLRSFKDANHKPEMILALSRFEGLIGLRRRADAHALFDEYDSPGAVRVRAALAGVDPIRSAVREVVALSTREVNELVAEAAVLAARGAGGPHETVVMLAGQYPGDAGAIASLLLNRMVLAPGECVHVPSGTPHAYLGGLAIEVMANSDNVFRVGLTSKRVDVEGLLQNLDVTEGEVGRVVPGQEYGARVFSPGVAEFELLDLEIDGGSAVLDGPGACIAVCVAGSLAVRGRAVDTHTLRAGAALFIGAMEGPLEVRGNGRLIAARVPTISPS